MNCQLSIHVVTLSLMIALVVDCTANAQNPAAWQYGHSSRWQSAREWGDSEKFLEPTSIEIGQGRAQIVSDGDLLFIASGSSTRDEDSKITSVTTTITAYVAQHGDLQRRWTFELESELRGDQQTFGGADASPQATPLVIGSNLIALSFTGQLVCLDRHSGEQLWSKDLVKEFAAVPVQFGFSSSPVIDSVDEGRFVVLAAGDRGGLLNMNAADGTLNWRSECKTPSYATPTTAHFGGISQWVVVSESHVLGIRNTDGKRLWQYELPESGLTNVPSPLIVNDSSLLVAGQGCKGIRCLEVGSNWRVVEKWYQSRANFFYTNWIMGDQQTAIGCTDGFLAAINTKTGELLGRWRGFSDGNLVRVGNQILLLDGKGKLTVFEQAGNSDSSQSETEYLRAILQVKLPEGRYWTPPSIVDRRLLVRTGSELLSIELSRAPNRTASNAREILANELREPLSLAIQRAADTKSFDPVALIFETFEQQGQIVALKRYEQLRSSGKLNIDQRIELAEAAGNQGLDGLAAMILEHANQDVPGNTKIKAALAELRK